MSYENRPGDYGGYGGHPSGDGYPQPPYGGYGYPPPVPYGYPPPPGRDSNGMAIASLVLGIIGLLTCAFTSILGVIFGHVALRQIRRTGQDGRGMAVAGLVTSYIGIAFWVVLAVLYLGFFAAAISAGGR